MINLGNLRLALSHKPRQNERCACAKVGRHDLTSAEFRVSLDDSLVSYSLNARSHLVQLGNVHESVLKHGLDYGALTLNRCQIRHERRLNVRRESRVWERLDVGRRVRPKVAPDDHVVVPNFNSDSALTKLGDDRLQMRRYDVRNSERPASDCRSQHKSPSLNSVWDNGMFGSMQTCDSLDFDGVSACALDLRSHFVQEVRKVDNLRLLSCVFDKSRALGQNSRHHDILSRTHARKVKVNRVADEPLRSCDSLDIAFVVVQRDNCAQCLQSLQMKVNWSCTDCAAARQRNPSFSLTRKKGPHNQNRGPHLVNKFKFCFRRRDILGFDGQNIFFEFSYFCSVRNQNFFHECHVAEHRNISDDAFVFSEQRRRHKRKHSVLRAADIDFALQRSALFYKIFSQFQPPSAYSFFISSRHFWQTFLPLMSTTSLASPQKMHAGLYFFSMM